MINPNTVGENASEQIPDNDGPWGRKYQESVPPFNPDQKPSSQESDDYYVDDDGVELRNLDKIDISTEQGKYEYLEGRIENWIAKAEDAFQGAKVSGDEDAILAAKSDLEEKRGCRHYSKVIWIMERAPF